MPDQRLRTNLTCKLKRKRGEHVAQEFDDKLSYTEARRLGAYGHHIYAVLIKEMYEEGCIHTAHHLEYLSAKEAQLIAKLVINNRMSDDRYLLFGICDLAKTAEKSARLHACDSHSTALKVLYELLIELENHELKYNWLLEDVYGIVIRLIETFDVDENVLNETKARIYYKYAILISKKPEMRQNAVEKFEQAANLCKGESWPPDNIKDLEQFHTLHAAVVARLSEVHFASAQDCTATQTDEAIAHCELAVSVLGQIGLRTNKRLICEAHLTYADVLLNLEQYHLTLLHLNSNQALITRDSRWPFIRLRCKLFLQKGIIFYNLNDINRSLQRLRMSFAICRLNDVKEFMGDILLYMGKAYAKRPADYSKSLRAFMSARRIFAAAGEKSRTKQLDYMLAKLQMERSFGEFMRMMKSKKFCQYHRLLEWKLIVRPFWLGDGQTWGELENAPDVKFNIKAATLSVSQLPTKQSKPTLDFKRTSADDVKCLMTEEYARCMKMPRPSPPSIKPESHRIAHRLIFNI